MNLGLQFLLTLKLARKTIELSSSGESWFQVAGINTFSIVIYMIKNTHICEFHMCACSYA
jgi:hypothetical protein